MRTLVAAAEPEAYAAIAAAMRALIARLAQSAGRVQRSHTEGN